MRGCLDRAPVIAGSDGEWINAVHDALVMGCCPVGINFGKLRGENNAVPDFFTRVTFTFELVG